MTMMPTQSNRGLETARKNSDRGLFEHFKTVKPAFGHFSNVRRVFDVPSGEPLVAIDDISIDLEQFHLVSLLGPSGCGKTTFLRIVAGLETATGGTVRVRGTDIFGPQEDFGFAFQTASLMPWRTVRDNILFPLEILKRNNAAGKKRAQELIDLVGLSGFEKARPAQLSGGMQQRVALCRALIHKPKLLLMDEPFGALDELTRMEMHDLLLNIRDVTRASVLFVTHSISEAVYLSDYVVVFSKRPAVIADYIEVDLSYPRTPEIRYSPRFTELEHRAGVALGISK
jgi:NitT/TauT family transport system ATP-binding protein